MSRNLSRADIDGSKGPGIAMLVTAILGGTIPGSPIGEAIIEGPDCDDPYRQAQALWESVKDDWPNFYHAIIQNERSHYLMWAARMKAKLGPEHGNINKYLE